jgi:hypothetical protein
MNRHQRRKAKSRASYLEEVMLGMEKKGLLERRRDDDGNIVMRDGQAVFWLTEAGRRYQRNHDPDLH